MRYTVRHGDAILGTVDLPRGEFVASRLTADVGYASVAAIVREATRAFLHIGLFHDVGAAQSAGIDVSADRRALGAAARLALALTDVRGRLVATHFINILEPAVDGGIVVLVSFDDDVASADSDDL